MDICVFNMKKKHEKERDIERYKVKDLVVDVFRSAKDDVNERERKKFYYHNHHQRRRFVSIHFHLLLSVFVA